MTLVEKDLWESERELLLYKVGQLELKMAVADMHEGAWTGSHGGKDFADQAKMKNGLMKWWRNKVATDPHPFTYCVRHLQKHVSNPERLCAWLKDQALGTTSWRGKKGLRESDIWQPSMDELRAASSALDESLSESDDDDLARLGDDGGKGNGGQEVAPPPAPDEQIKPDPPLTDDDPKLDEDEGQEDEAGDKDLDTDDAPVVDPIIEESAAAIGASVDVEKNNDTANGYNLIAQQVVKLAELYASEREREPVQLTINNHIPDAPKRPTRAQAIRNPDGTMTVEYEQE